ncbi:MAG TPA: hypothetical protein VFH99_02740 [Candidatus Saccharimonadales bacterium]|nr:hypothetical protein [Candidatus Saccharimonadales bacterium]
MAAQRSDPDKITEISTEALHRLIQQRDSAFKRLPLLFTLLGAFGLMATFYGFQHIINKIPVLADNPLITLCVGLLTLLLTGTLYKKLG